MRRKDRENVFHQFNSDLPNNDDQSMNIDDLIVELAKEKGTPVLEKAANEVRERAVLVTKEVLKKLESKEAK